jgi:uncharacterized membrane protein
MTASKSSRARAARARARSGNPAVRGSQNGTAVKPGPAVKAGPADKTSPADKASPADKSGTVARAGSTPRTVATRDRAPERSGARGPAAEREAAAGGPATGTVPLWLQLTTFGLALAGLGVSIYLTVAHFTETALLGCSESGGINCTKVTTSPQSYVFGIPVAVLGMAFYVFVVAIMSPWAWRWARREVHLIRLAAMVAGIGFVLYLVYAELFLIGAICLYCTSVHAITFVLFGLTVFAAAAWGIPKNQHA